jgi:glycosyltransferase involved in cell wall biosynthesis
MNVRGDGSSRFVVSIVTAAFNSSETISSALKSVQSQHYRDIQHVVIDGGSTDGTQSVVAGFPHVSTLISEPDGGIYDALNKGVAVANGDVIGFLNSDDFLSDGAVISDIADAFRDPEVQAVYGDLVYVDRVDTRKVIRRWSAGKYSLGKVRWGWMPPHPTLYVRRHCFASIGGFNAVLRVAGDYDWFLRLCGSASLRIAYIPRNLVHMRMGGISNRSLSTIFLKSSEDYAALRRHGVGGGMALLCKSLRKIGQWF